MSSTAIIAETPALQVSVQTEPGQAASTRRTADGKVQFESSQYRITAGDDNEVVIENRQTGETYRVWGDPHVEIDGMHAFDFAGRTTFVLDDGTRVTMVTKVVLADALFGMDGFGYALTSRVYIVDGDYTVCITGIDSNRLGDLDFIETTGAAFDYGGNRVYENPFGGGLIVDSGEGARIVDQAYIDTTDASRSNLALLMRWYGQAFSAFGAFASIRVQGDLSQQGPEEARRDTDAQVPRDRLADAAVSFTLFRPDPRA